MVAAAGAYKLTIRGGGESDLGCAANLPLERWGA
jgi:hypothetical protein